METSMKISILDVNFKIIKNGVNIITMKYKSIYLLIFEYFLLHLDTFNTYNTLE